MIQWNYLKLSLTQGLKNLILLTILTFIFFGELSGINAVFITSLWIAIVILIGVDISIARKMDIKYSDKLLKVRSLIESFSMAFIISAISFVMNSSDRKATFLIATIVVSSLLALILFLGFYSLNKRIAMAINR